MERPSDMFDRASEWQGLVDVSTNESDGATLGVVSGRRRQGKSYLLESLCEAAGGFYFAATEATEAESLRLLADAIADYAGTRLPVRFERWEEAIDALLALGEEDRPVPVVLDEFPYLCRSSPALPSFKRHTGHGVANACVPGPDCSCAARRSRSWPAALRLRSAARSGWSDLMVQTFDCRLADEFWGLDDSRLAVQVYSIVGGTPAYRREFVEDDVPRSASDFDA